MKNLIKILKLLTLVQFLYRPVVQATVVLPSQSELYFHCRPGSSMLASDLCGNQVYNALPVNTGSRTRTLTPLYNTHENYDIGFDYRPGFHYPNARRGPVRKRPLGEQPMSMMYSGVNSGRFYDDPFYVYPSSYRSRGGCATGACNFTVN